MRLIAEYNNRLAHVYDDATSKRGAWKAPAECARLLRGVIRSRLTILDIGIGTGKSCLTVVGPGQRIVGLDISDQMLAVAQRRLPRAKLILADIETNIPLPRRPMFDLVLAIGIFEFTENLNRLFREIAQRLNHGGVVCFTYEEQVPHNRLQRFRKSARGYGLFATVPRLLSFPVYRRTWPEVKALLKSRGLTVLKHRRFIAYNLHDSITGGNVPVLYRAVLVKQS